MPSIDLGSPRLLTPSQSGKLPELVEQEVWGVLLVFNLVRLEMVELAVEAKVMPNQISYDSLAEAIQLLYTSHSPFLVDADRLERVRKVYVASDGSTKASRDLGFSDTGWV